MEQNIGVGGEHTPIGDAARVGFDQRLALREAAILPEDGDERAVVDVDRVRSLVVGGDAVRRHG